jgi:glyoxylase-like metal-dependent hydrolase (beta-lactamase superfamily II)
MLEAAGLITLVILVTVTVLLVYRKAAMSVAKGIFAISLNNAFGIIKSSFMMRVVGTVTKRKVPKGLPDLVEFEKVSPRAFRVLGLNPGPHTLQGTNTWLICGSTNAAEHVLIDTGEDTTADAYIALLFDKVFPAAGTKRLSKILLTHGHGDHQGGVLRILDELKSRNMLPLPTIYKRNVANGNYPQGDFPCEHICDLEIFKVDEDTTLQACYTPGHTDDHVGFLLHEDSAILSGDCVLGCGTTVFDNLFEYMQSLKRIRQIIVDSNSVTQAGHTTRSATKGDPLGGYPYKFHTIYPGHGPVIRDTALEKIDEYILHRDAREEQIVRILGCRDAPTAHCHETGGHRHADVAVPSSEPGRSHAREWHASWDIMCQMYGHLPFIIQVSAMHNVSHHLEKLQQEGRVETRWPDLWRAKL